MSEPYPRYGTRATAYLRNVLLGTHPVRPCTAAQPGPVTDSRDPSPMVAAPRRETTPQQ